MKKIIMLAVAAMLAFNVSAADKKAKKQWTLMLAELKLSDEQNPKFQALQKEQKEFLAAQQQRSAEEKKTAGKPFWKARTAKLKELFTEDQMSVWNAYQAKQKAARKKKAQEK